ADAIAARGPEIAVERLPERERAGDVVRFVAIETLLEALAVLREVRIAVLLSQARRREREDEQRGAKSREDRHRSEGAREPSSWLLAETRSWSRAAEERRVGVTCGSARRALAARCPRRSRSRTRMR